MVDDEEVDDVEEFTSLRAILDKEGGDRDYLMVGECVRFLFTSCEESKTNE